MSKAFTREDVDPPERSGRLRSASGLPPGATNYITVQGARRLREERARRSPAVDLERLEELDRILGSVTIVDPANAEPNSIAFGSVVTVEDAQGVTEIYRIVGVDELGFEGNSVSWISPVGKTLLAAEIGQRVTLGTGSKARLVKIVRAEYPSS